MKKVMPSNFHVRRSTVLRLKLLKPSSLLSPNFSVAAMPKRKSTTASDGASDSGSDRSMLDIDLEFFDPQPQDFRGLKMLLRQLLDVDADAHDLSALADLILSQPLLGTTVKCPDDEYTARENDPFAFLTVLNLHTHRGRPEIEALTEWLARRCEASDRLRASAAPSLLRDRSGAVQLGLVLTERLVNMPAQVLPPMYSMIAEEIAWAVEAGEPYRFTHFLVLSKAYLEVASQLDDAVVMEDGGADGGEQRSRAKKTKKNGGAAGPGGGATGAGAETFYFHLEDEKLHEYAAAWGNFRYEKEGQDGASDARRAFQEAGIMPIGHAILIDKARWEEAVKGVSDYLGSEP